VGAHDLDLGNDCDAQLFVGGSRRDGSAQAGKAGADDKDVVGDRLSQLCASLFSLQEGYSFS